MNSEIMPPERSGRSHELERAARVIYHGPVDLRMPYPLQVFCDSLEQKAVLTAVEREVIACAVEQADHDGGD
jgi:hypothetical protein